MEKLACYASVDHLSESLGHSEEVVLDNTSEDKANNLFLGVVIIGIFPQQFHFVLWELCVKLISEILEDITGVALTEDHGGDHNLIDAMEDLNDDLDEEHLLEILSVLFGVFLEPFPEKIGAVEMWWVDEERDDCISGDLGVISNVVKEKSVNNSKKQANSSEDAEETQYFHTASNLDATAACLFLIFEAILGRLASFRSDGWAHLYLRKFKDF